MKIRSAAPIVLAIILAMLFSISKADIWRWTDPETGVVVYGGQPPADVSAEAVKIRENSGHADVVNTQPGNSADRIKARVEELRDQRLERGKQKQEAQEERLATNQRSEACQSAKSNLETLSSRGQGAAIVKDGERHALTDEERQGYIASTQRFMDEHCTANKKSQ